MRDGNTAPIDLDNQPSTNSAHPLDAIGKEERELVAIMSNDITHLKRSMDTPTPRRTHRHLCVRAGGGMLP